MICSSKPAKRRLPFGTICGAKLPSRSRGASIRTWPCWVASVFGVIALRVFPAPPGGGWPCAEPRCSVSSASIARSTSRRVRSASKPPGPTISSSLRAPASNSSINSSLRRSRTSSGNCSPGAPAARAPPASRCARPPGSLRETPARGRPSLSIAVLVFVDMRLLFAHAYTEDRTLPRWGAAGQLTDLQLVAGHSMQCLGVEHNSLQDAKDAVQLNCDGVENPSINWRAVLVDTLDGFKFYRISNVNSEKCLAVAWASKDAGARVVQATCNWKDNQLWFFYNVSNGT